MVPVGIHIRTPALTTHGLLEDDFIKVANFIHEGVDLVRVRIQVKRVDHIQNSSSNEELNLVGFEEHNDIKAEEHIM